MSAPVDTIILRRARPGEQDELESLERRAALEFAKVRDELDLSPGAVHLPAAQVANGQVIVAEYRGQIAGLAAVVGGEL